MLTVLKAAVLPTLRDVLVHGIWGGSLLSLYGGAQCLHRGL